MGGILKAPFMKELVRTCTTMFRLGWNERNGGNISIIVDEGEAAKYLDTRASLREFDLSFDAAELEGRILAVTRTGSYFRNVKVDPEYNLGLVRIGKGGKSAALLWGFAGGGGPTSELSSHLLSHITRLRQDTRHRVVTHCHATNTLAMTLVHDLDDRSFTRTLWKMMTECIIVFPEGVGVLPWMICGNDEIGRATAEKMKDYRVCVWAQHGVFAAGNSLDEALGLIEAVEKAAQVYIMVMNGTVRNVIKDGELKVLAESFAVNYRKDFLD
ncbi:MAG: rhamnulose-1-phosphate aldolase [Treponema sp.]|jgi:rhamnulose-1-phosphate aldolase|nr:rhamnulose-1-phosphate aldolase [Treponema sp.]